MAYGFLFAGCISGFSWYYDPIKSENRNPFGLWDLTPACRPAVCNQFAVSLLFLTKENLNLEQKKATQRVALNYFKKNGLRFAASVTRLTIF